MSGCRRAGIGRYLTALIYLLFAAFLIPYAYGQTIPVNAKLYIPNLKTQVGQAWPTMPQPVLLAGQVEQETCVSLTWPSCWNPHTELKTSREYGFGLGQLTITASFNNFTALQKLNDPTIKTWKWENRYDPNMQLRALIDMDLLSFNEFKAIGLTTEDQLSFMFSAYNGGAGGLIQDIKYCTALPKCNHRVWLGNVADNSLKQKTAVKGYGQSFFQINRSYVTNILTVRSPKYAPFFTPKQ